MKLTVLISLSFFFQAFTVTSIPRLVVCSSNGKEVTRQGREDVEELFEEEKDGKKEEELATKVLERWRDQTWDSF